MSLENVETLTGVKNDERLDVIYQATKKRLFRRLKSKVSEIKEVPEELEYVVEEVTIKRFNQIGNEGMETYSQEGESIKYKSDLFSEYSVDIADWIAENTEPDLPRKGKVVFY